jgi:hypothetical protein
MTNIAAVRIIKDTSNNIIVQHRMDGVYDNGNYPIPLGDVADYDIVDADDTDLVLVEDPQAQIDIVAGNVVYSLGATTRQADRAGGNSNARSILNNLDGWLVGDFTHAYVKQFLEALADLIFETRTGGPV